MPTASVEPPFATQALPLPGNPGGLASGCVAAPGGPPRCGRVPPGHTVGALASVRLSFAAPSETAQYGTVLSGRLVRVGLRPRGDPPNLYQGTQEASFWLASCYGYEVRVCCFLICGGWVGRTPGRFLPGKGIATVRLSFAPFSFWRRQHSVDKLFMPPMLKDEPKTLGSGCDVSQPKGFCFAKVRGP
jgi:hypothetical protein